MACNVFNLSDKAKFGGWLRDRMSLAEIGWHCGKMNQTLRCSTELCASRACFISPQLWSPWSHTWIPRVYCTFCVPT
jgi:hypothetical protein